MKSDNELAQNIAILILGLLVGYLLGKLIESGII